VRGEELKMNDNLNEELSADLTKEDRKDLIKLQISESAKSIELCKRKQWYVVAVGIIFNFGIIYISNNTIDVIFSLNMFKLFFLLIFCILLGIFGFCLINDLLDTIEKQRTQIYFLNQWLLGRLPEEWQKAFINQKTEYDKDRHFAGILNTIIIFSSILCFLILCALMAHAVTNFLKYPGAY
jgi:hypothetical protein